MVTPNGHFSHIVYAVLLHHDDDDDDDPTWSLPWLLSKPFSLIHMLPFGPLPFPQAWLLYVPIVVSRESFII